MSTVRVTLPFPCSVNTMFPTRGKVRVPSPAYRAWRDEAAYRIRFQNAKRVAGAVNVRIDLVAPDRRRRDCDNYAKGCLDALVKNGVIDDDSAVMRLSIGWEPSGEPCTVTVTAINPSDSAIGPTMTESDQSETVGGMNG